MVKIGYYDFWYNGGENFLYNNIINPLDKYGLNYKIVNPFDEEADIIFDSVFDYNNKNCIKGNPIIIRFTGENYLHKQTSLKNIVDYNYSLSFLNDSETNLYFPLWQIQINDYFYNFYNKNRTEVFNNKNKFCTFLFSNYNCFGNLSKERADVCKYIMNNYKKIDCCGSVLNNTGFILERNKRVVFDYFKNYKFNICYENSTSEGNNSYITEKIIQAYGCNTIPIYKGSKNINKWFNEESFINCNDLSFEEILDRVKEIDNDDILYKRMLEANPFINNEINWKDYCEERLYNFILKILF